MDTSTARDLQRLDLPGMESRGLERLGTRVGSHATLATCMISMSLTGSPPSDDETFTLGIYSLLALAGGSADLGRRLGPGALEKLARTSWNHRIGEGLSALSKNLQARQRLAHAWKPLIEAQGPKRTSDDWGRMQVERVHFTDLHTGLQLRPWGEPEAQVRPAAARVRSEPGDQPPVIHADVLGQGSRELGTSWSITGGRTLNVSWITLRWDALRFAVTDHETLRTDLQELDPAVVERLAAGARVQLATHACGPTLSWATTLLKVAGDHPHLNELQKLVGRYPQG